MSNVKGEAMRKTAIRQGDVLISPCADIPTTAKPVAAEHGHLIVARGEATGHHHSFTWKAGATLFRDDGTGGGSMYVDVTAPVQLNHQEHHALTLLPGKYVVRIQRTMSAGLVRQVQD
jgi:hypothetical protein